MKRFLLVILLASVSFAQLSQPPIAEVMANNRAAALSLEGYYNESSARNASLTLVFGAYRTSPSVAISMDLAGPSLVLDNMTYPVNGLSLIIARGYRADPLMGIHNPGYLDFPCDAYFFAHITDENAWRCDFDQDSCVEYVADTSLTYNADVLFTFRNVTVSTPLSSNVIAVPHDVLDEMKNSSGLDTLDVAIDGSATFVYTVNDQEASGNDCSNHIVRYSVSIPLSLNSSYVVAGENKLFFLRAPVLREQWFRDNRFDIVVLSQSPLYHADILLNGNISRSFQLRTFDVTPGAYGLVEIVSNKTSECAESRNLTTPVPLEEANNSFSYTYEFAFTYPGLGNNDLSLSVYDSFMGHTVYTDTLLSRMLSYGGTTTENGSPVGSVPSRGSIGSTEDDLGSIKVGLGLLLFLLILPFIRFWIRK